MKILIVENDVLIAEHLAQIVKSFQYEVAGIAFNKDDAIKSIDKNPPDMALLDVRIQELYDGIEIGEYVRQNHSIPIVYVTAHSENKTVEKALKTKPNGYVLKPFKESEILAAIGIAVQNFRKEQSDEFFFIKNNYKAIKLLYNEVLYLKSNNNHIEIHTKTNQYYQRMGLQEMLDNQDDEIFIRVHRSFAVNKNRITKYTARKLYINTIEIPVSRKYSKTAKKLIEKQLIQ